MTKLHSLPPLFFDRVVLRYPKTVLLCMLTVVVFLAFQARDFKLDASAETLVLENDEDLRYSRLIGSRYEQNDFLVLTFAPKDDLFSDKTLATLARLRDDLSALQRVTSVISILDVPLLESPPTPLKELSADLPTLTSPKADRDLARIEFRDSPLYRNLLVGEDLKTTALIIYFADDQLYHDMLAHRNDLRQKKASASLTAPQHAELKRVTEQFRQYRGVMRQQRHQDITAIRNIMEKYRPNADLFLGGVGMIADDMITFVRGDLKVFGMGVLFFLIVTLGVIFRSLRWICIPLLCCLVSVVCMIGLLGWLGWDVTVISSNFISLQLIITLAMTIHLMVRYRESALQQPQAGQHELIFATIQAMLRPCVYSGLTTMAGFASLILCDIRPVIDFGYIMVVGVAISIIVPFLLLPTMLVLLPRDKPWSRGKAKWSLTPALGRFTVAHGTLIVVGSVALLILNVVGIRKLQVENCFINYFKSSTEIHRGMKVLDQQLGGTTPLDVVIDFEQTAPSEAALSNDAADTDAVFDQFDEFDTASQQTKHKYWFTPEKMARIAAVHDYLDGLPETGKVLSVLTLVRMAERLNGGKALDGVELALLFNQIPERLKEMLVNPYVSVEHNQVRITVRIRDSDPSLKRNEFLSRIRADLTGRLGYRPEQIRLAGTLVLYNNMLQSLYSSQIVTMGFASLFLMGTFVVLFRSLRTAAIAIFPNVLAVSCVLGVMGWLGIPLDMMTITIAAIGVGLADDDTIHYIHRFKHEVAATGSYRTALHQSHDSIGHAIYYTTVTLVIGFSFLSLSNFIPTIYFGLLTVLAITVALLASLTLLPQLLVLIKPFGKDDYMKTKACLAILAAVLITGCAASKPPGPLAGKNQSIRHPAPIVPQQTPMVPNGGAEGPDNAAPAQAPPVSSAEDRNGGGDSAYVPPADDDFNLLEDQLAQQQVKVADPLKPLNRAMHNVNDKLYFSVLRPVARACKRAVPKPARISIRNFFNNLTTPARYVSCLLQGKRKAAGTELHRFALNTTVGVLGFADPAQEKWKLAPTDEDLGQTLGKWGVGNGVYVVLPLLGPSTVRDTLGLIGGQLLNPVHYVEPTEVSLAISAGKIANENTFTIGRYESFKSAAVDPYTAMRQAYIQYRDKQVKD